MSAENIEFVLNRLKEVFSAKTDAALARAINVPKTTLSSWRQRKSVPYLKCVQLAEQHQISLEWLLTGRGENTRPPESELGQQMSDSESELARSKQQESNDDSNSYRESELSIPTKGKVPIIGTQIEGMVVSEFEKLSFEQQIQVLEYIMEKRRLNDLENQVSALAARR